MNASEFMEKYGVTMDVTFVDIVRGEWEHTVWRAIASYDKDGVDRDLTFSYRTGMGLTGGNHDFEAGALHCAALDASIGQYSFREYCDEFGSDGDAADAHETWEACVKARQDAYHWVRSEAMWDDFVSIQD